MTYTEAKRALEDLIESDGWKMVLAAIGEAIKEEGRNIEANGSGDFWQEAARTARIRGTLAGLRILPIIPERILADLKKKSENPARGGA